MGRQWVSPAGNVYASTIVRLRDGDPPAATLSFVAGLAVYYTIAEITGDLPIQIKWPNDILNGDGEKLAGILLEREGSAVIVGIGVNLVYSPENIDRPASSLRQMGFDVPPPQIFVEGLAHHMAHYVALWREAGTVPILKEWQARAHPPGQEIAATLPDGQKLQGEYRGLDENGALMLGLADGKVHAIHAGDVFLV